MGNETPETVSSEPTASAPNEVGILSEILGKLTPLQPEVRARLLQTVMTFFNINSGSIAVTKAEEQGRSPVPKATSFSDHPDLSPKEFVLQKEPRTDAERITCLAYYLTHFRGEPHFRTLDLTKLNTEAAHAKFSNPAVAVESAVRRGFLVPAPDGARQLGAVGERFVQALPDRDAAKAVLEKVRSRKSNRNKRTSEADDDSATTTAEAPEQAN